MDLLLGRIRRLETLLEDLLAYSRVCRIAAPVERVIVKDMISGLFNMLNTEHRFKLFLDTDVATIRTRRSQLEQIFLNLFSNALKHHDRADGRISVTVTEADDLYEFTVADDGPGIPEAHRDRVLQIFQTLRLRDDTEGSGMGLAIIKKPVDRQGGTIAVEDAPGERGVLFRFSWKKIVEADEQHDE